LRCEGAALAGEQEGLRIMVLEEIKILESMGTTHGG
jgi:hypothetical protein